MIIAGILAQLHSRLITRRCAALPIATLLFIVTTGCTHQNVQLNAHSEPLAQRDSNTTRATITAPAHEDADGTFVGIAISGGGSRSANFAAGCMIHLERLGILPRADYISSVSGGSLTAAAYCLYDETEWNPESIQDKLTHSFASDVIVNTVLPWNFVALLVTHWDRSDLLASSFRKTMFSRDGRPLTFGDLRADRPRLLINATDLQSGQRFVFCNETFDELNSDLSQYPIADAVAAGAAVPVLMHHVTLRDYSTTFKQYRHLVDGGVVDNLGIRTLATIYDNQTRNVPEGQNPYPNGAVFIVLDARTQFDAKISDKADIGLIETIATGAGLTSTALLNRASSATMADLIVHAAPDDATARELREHIDALEATGWLEMTDVGGRPIRVLHVGLARVKNRSDLPFASFHEKVNSIATYFDIDDTSAYHLYQAADLLMEEVFDQPLNRIATELDAAAPAQSHLRP